MDWGGAPRRAASVRPGKVQQQRTQDDADDQTDGRAGVSGQYAAIHAKVTRPRRARLRPPPGLSIQLCGLGGVPLGG